MSTQRKRAGDWAWRGKLIDRMERYSLLQVSDRVDKIPFDGTSDRKLLFSSMSRAQPTRDAAALRDMYSLCF